MKVVSTNTGSATEVLWRGKKEKTGIYKYPTDSSIYLEREDVRGDIVVDRKVHGGIDKACYIYAENHYPFWKQKYPDLDWQYGMFGENLTINGLEEHLIYIGAIYTIGTAVVQISQPRRPCYKLGIRFGTQDILKQFIDASYPGVYVRVIKPGEVKIGDEFIVKEVPENKITVQQIFQLLHHTPNSVELIQEAIDHPFISINNRNTLLRKFKR